MKEGHVFFCGKSPAKNITRTRTYNSLLSKELASDLLSPVKSFKHQFVTKFLKIR